MPAYGLKAFRPARRRVGRTRRANRYCIDCGGRMTYYPRLSSPNVPNEYRVLVYACPDCTRKAGRPKMVAVRRRRAEDPLATLEKETDEERRRVRGRPGAPRRGGGAEGAKAGGDGA